MVARYCRRSWWVRLIRWTVVSLILFLLAWTYRSWVFHGVSFLSSSEYRACLNRRNQYSASIGHETTQHPNLYVTVANHGRLGNWMFQYAALLGIAEVNGFTPYFLQWHSLSYNFQLSHLHTHPVDCLTVIEDPKPMSFVDKLTHLPQANITLDGYLQSWKYFRNVNDQVRNEFKFSENTKKIIQKNFDSYVGRHVRAGREVISIHVRRGDTLKSGAQRLGFKPAPKEYFVNAMRYMLKRYPFSVFLIVSDDLEWCWENIGTVLLKYYKETQNGESLSSKGKNGDGYYEYVSSKSKVGKVFIDDGNGNEEPLHHDAKNVDKLIKYIHMKEEMRNAKNIQGLNESEIMNRKMDIVKKDTENFVYSGSPPLVIAPLSSSIYDFGLLTLANHSIMSVGSFGWWGAWLAGGDVVYYDDWPEKGHRVYYEWTREDYFPPHWVALSGSSIFFPMPVLELGLFSVGAILVSLQFSPVLDMNVC